MRTANLLPWRQQQQRHCLRFWGVLFTGSLLLTLVLWTALRAGSSLQTHVYAQRQASDLALRQALEQRQKQWAALMVQRQQRQRWVQQKAKTEAWQAELIALAHALPEQAWLTQLRFQQSTLSLLGYASTLPALTALETALRQLPEFRPGMPGEIRQDAQGRWQFSWTLTRKELTDADPS